MLAFVASSSAYYYYISRLGFLSILTFYLLPGTQKILVPGDCNFLFFPLSCTGLLGKKKLKKTGNPDHFLWRYKKNSCNTNFQLMTFIIKLRQLWNCQRQSNQKYIMKHDLKIRWFAVTVPCLQETCGPKNFFDAHSWKKKICLKYIILAMLTLQSKVNFLLFLLHHF